MTNSFVENQSFRRSYASSEPIGIVICDSVRLFREGLLHVLRSTGLDIRQLASSLSDWKADTDVVIWGMDPSGDIGPQLEDLRIARERQPNARFVAFVNPADVQQMRQVAAAGVDAVLSRDISGEVLHRALELVVLGQQLFPAAVLSLGGDIDPFRRAALAVNPLPGTPGTPPVGLGPAGLRTDVALSEREAQILRCLVEGSSNKLIARELEITEATVKVHIKGLLRKIGASNRTQAAIWGLANGFRAATEPDAA